MRPLESPWRAPTATAAAVAGLAHFLAACHHLHHAPYVGWLFLAFSAAALVLVFAMALYDTGPLYVGGAILGVTALAAYALFHSVPMPQMQDEVGDWLDPYGVVSIVSESILVAACTFALRRPPRKSRRDVTPSLPRPSESPRGLMERGRLPPDN